MYNSIGDTTHQNSLQGFIAMAGDNYKVAIIRLCNNRIKDVTAYHFGFTTSVLFFIVFDKGRHLFFHFFFKTRGELGTGKTVINRYMFNNIKKM